MTRHLRTPASVAIVTVLLGVGAAPQWPSGLSSDWKDLDTWSHEVPETKNTVFGLGLQPVGASGTMRVAFSATLLRTAPDAAPKGVTVQLAQSPNASPNAIRAPKLAFLVNERTPRQASIDLGPRLTFPAFDMYQHALISSMQATLAPAEFLQIANAEKLNATILTMDVAFRPDQIRALRAFADRIHLTTPARRRR